MDSLCSRVQKGHWHRGRKEVGDGATRGCEGPEGAVRTALPYKATGADLFCGSNGFRFAHQGLLRVLSNILIGILSSP